MPEHPRLRNYQDIKRGLELRKQQAIDLLAETPKAETPQITPEDQLRLARVLELIRQHQPKRSFETGPTAVSTNEILASEHSTLQFLQNRIIHLLTSLTGWLRRDAQEPVERSSVQGSPAAASTVRAKLLASELVATLRELRRLDTALNIDYEPPAITELASQQRTTSAVREETNLTPITLDYQKEEWGLKRICLDGVQNHLPADALGTAVAVVCEVNGQWQPLEVARATPDQITAVRFVDDGVGYDPKNLEMFWSGKTDDSESAGQFGEGAKMLAAATLREGISVTFASQSWEAEPFAQVDTIRDFRKKRDVEVKRLGINVKHFPEAPMRGSHTTFRQVTPEFIREVMEMPDLVLPLRDHYRPWFSCDHGEIVPDFEGGKIFVKGIFVSTAVTALSYNLVGVKINRDRNAVLDGLGQEVDKMLQALTSKRVVKVLLERSIQDNNLLEGYQYPFYSPDHPLVWRQAFYELYGEDAVLDTGFNPPQYVKVSHRKISLREGLRKRLQLAGVPTDVERTPSEYTERLKTSLTTEYGAGVWGPERILLDAIQNHFPEDSGGSGFSIQIQVIGGDGQLYWTEYSNLNNLTDDQIRAISIKDDGHGYDAQKLALLASEKSGESAGKFGEGLKMITAACLRLGVNVTLASRDWEAVATTEDVQLDTKPVKQVVFDVTHRPLAKSRHGSMTLLSNLPAELVGEIRHLGEKMVNANTPYETSSEIGAILKYTGGLLFVRRLIVPGGHNILFSYHFPKLEMQNRDRNVMSRDVLMRSVGEVIGSTNTDAFVRQYLFLAERAIKDSDPDPRYLEFTSPFQVKNPALWKKSFETNFGNRTAIRPASSLDFDAVGQLAHVGLKVVTLPDTVFNSLKVIGLPTYEEKLRELNDVQWLEPTELTSDEHTIIAVLQQLGQFLPADRPDEIKVFMARDPKQQVAFGLSNGRTIGLNRSVLAEGLEYAADVYLHEKTHHNTGGAEDAAQGFRNYLTLALARVSLRLLAETSGGLAGHTESTAPLPRS